jgi:transglutaminase-like putative cysteine protease
MESTLQPTYYLDANEPSIQTFAAKHTTHARTEVEKAVALYYAVRDGFWYSPYRLDFRPEGLKASAFLNREPKAGHCLNKAMLLSASARAVGIPSRLSFYHVRNHLATERLEKMLGTNLLVFHTAAELWLEGRWVKATPAFNKALCDKLGVETLEFTGREDSIFQEYDSAGRQFMHYEYEYGAFDDLPFDLMKSELLKYYGHVLTEELIAAHDGVIDVERLAGQYLKDLQEGVNA